MTGAPTHGWAPVDLFAVGSEPLRPTIGGVLTPRLAHLFSGEPDSAKSWAAMVLCVDDVIRAGRCALWIDFEMGERQIVERLRALELDDEEIASGFFVIAPKEPLGAETERELDRTLANLEPALVVIDAMTGALELHGLSSNDDVHIESLYRRLIDRFTDAGAAVVVIDHLAKDRENRGKWAVGSQRKVGRADVHIGVECVRPFARGHDGLVRLRVHKDRAGWLPRPYAAELELHSDQATGAVTWEWRMPERDGTASDASHWQPTHLMERVSRQLEEWDEPANRNAIETAVGGNAKFVRQAIDCLVMDGFASEVVGARRARIVRIVTPYRERGPSSGDDQAEAERLEAKHADLLGENDDGEEVF